MKSKSASPLKIYLFSKQIYHLIYNWICVPLVLEVPVQLHLHTATDTTNTETHTREQMLETHSDLVWAAIGLAMSTNPSFPVIQFDIGIISTYNQATSQKHTLICYISDIHEYW